MSKKKQVLKGRWKLIINIVTVMALVGLLFILREQIFDTLRNLSKVNLLVLLLLLPLAALSYHGQTKMLQGLFRMVGNEFSYKFLIKVALELNFVNRVFPSGGISGISYFGMRMRSKDVTGGRASLVQIMKTGLIIVSFEALLVVGLLFMAIGGQANDLVLLIAGSISTLLVVGTVAFIGILGSERRIHTTFRIITKVLNRLIHFVRPKSPETINMVRVEQAVQELHDNYKLIASRYRELRWPIIWAVVTNAAEILAIYTVYVAFGELVNPGAIILAYAVANLAGLVAVLPGGIGIYEALMTAVLAAAGIPAALSLPVTVMFRVLSTAIQVPPGYYFYHKAVRRLGADVPEAIKSH